MIKYNDIKIKVNYPEDKCWNEEIENRIAKWIFERQLDQYENIYDIYPIWIEIKGKESSNITFEEAKKIVIREYELNKKKE